MIEQYKEVHFEDKSDSTGGKAIAFLAAILGSNAGIIYGPQKVAMGDL